jgi:hypothetical protein
MRVHRGESSGVEWRAAVLAALAYTTGVFVFVFAFAVGAIRVTPVAPCLGALLAVVLEGPVVLAMSWLLAGWCISRLRVGPDSRTRVLMGAVAFAALMALELAVSVGVFGERPDQYLARFGTAPGAVGLTMQVCFALIPWAQSKRHRRIAQD